MSKRNTRTMTRRDFAKASAAAASVARLQPSLAVARRQALQMPAR